MFEITNLVYLDILTYRERYEDLLAETRTRGAS